MTTPGEASSGTAAPDDVTPAQRCERARELAEAGELEAAASIFEEVARADAEHRPEAAMGLAVVREKLGDTERAGAAWSWLLETGDSGYAAAAHYGLGGLADAAGQAETAEEHWREALASGSAVFAPLAAQDLAGRLLEARSAGEACEVLERGLAAGDLPTLRVALGIARLEQALQSFSAAAESDDPEVTPLAVELLARGLPLRGQDEAAADVWRQGLAHADPAVAADVRARLRRDFATGGSWDDEDDDATAEAWWEPYLESAVRQGSLPVLAGEAFGVLDQLFTLIAVAHTQGGGRKDRDHERLAGAVGEALRVPGEYVWGADLHDSFRERLRQALGSDRDVLPTNWPEEP